MKIQRLIWTMFALLTGSLLRSETVLVTASVGGCEALHILSVYQRGSEVFVTKHLEELGFACGAFNRTLQSDTNGMEDMANRLQQSRPLAP